MFLENKKSIPIIVGIVIALSTLLGFIPGLDINLMSGRASTISELNFDTDGYAIFEAESFNKEYGLILGFPKDAPSQAAFFSNGAITKEINFPKTKRYALQILARGSQANNQWPQMVISLDNNIIYSTAVRGNNFQTYGFVRRLPKGMHILKISFVNDYYDKSTHADRNLFVDKVKIFDELTYGELRDILSKKNITFAPSRSMDIVPTRAQFISDLVKQLGLDLVNPREPSFVDVPSTHPNYREIETARANGWYTNSNFHPSLNVFRNFAMTIMNNIKPEDIGKRGHRNKKEHIIYGTKIAFPFFHDIVHKLNPVQKTQEERDIYKEHIKELFGWVVPGGSGQMWLMHYNAEDEYYWGYLDSIYQWAENNGIKVKYHSLIWPWYSHLPDWYNNLEQKKRMFALQKHIKTIVRRYGDRTDMYDVVNEPLREFGSKNFMGTGWDTENAIRYIFKWAKEEDPTAEMLINEALIIESPSRRTKYINLINDLLDAGASIDAVGIQAHLGQNNHQLPSEDTIVNALNEVHNATGLPIYITEFDIEPPGFDDNLDPSAPFAGYSSWWAYQAYAYKKAFDVFSSHPGVKGVFLWGSYDGTHWKPGAGLFDADWNEKPVFHALEAVLKANKD